MEAMNADLIQKENERKETMENYNKLRSEFDALQKLVGFVCMYVCMHACMYDTGNL
jgi:hypothetical protein